MKTKYIKVGSLFLLLFLITSCVSKEVHEKVKEKLEECVKELNISKKISNKNNIQGEAFDSEGYYKENGFFSLRVNIPYKYSIDSRGNRVYLEPSIVNHIDISTPKNKIILQLFQHGEDNFDDLRDSTIPIKQYYDRGYVQHIITQFDPVRSTSRKDTVYVIALHDEAYYDTSRTPSEKQEIIRCLQQAAINNRNITPDCFGIIFKDFPLIPRTIGGGVIPPK